MPFFSYITTTGEINENINIIIGTRDMRSNRVWHSTFAKFNCINLCR